MFVRERRLPTGDLYYTSATNITPLGFAETPDSHLNNQHASIQLHPARVLIVLIGIVVLLVGLSIWGQYLRFFQDAVDMQAWMEMGLDLLTHKSYMDAETNIPTWFNTVLLFCIAILSWLIGTLKVRERAPFRWHWMGLGVLFGVLSIDELAVLHEMLIKPFRDLTGAGGWFYFAWVLPGIAFVMVMALAYAPFFYRLEGRTRNLMLISLAVYFAGAIGGEMLSGRVASLIGQRNFSYAVIATLEESVEMTGAALLIYTLLKYIERCYGSVQFMTARGGATADERR